MKGTNIQELKPDKVKSKARHVLVNTERDEMNEHTLKGWKSTVFLFLMINIVPLLCNLFFRSGSVSGRQALQENTALCRGEKSKGSKLAPCWRWEDKPAHLLPAAAVLPYPSNPAHQSIIQNPATYEFPRHRGQDLCSWTELWAVSTSSPQHSCRAFNTAPFLSFCRRSNEICNVVSKVWMINGDSTSTCC